MIQSTRAIASSLLRASRLTFLPTTFQRWSDTKHTPALPTSRPVWPQARWQSQDSVGGNQSSKAYSFEDVSPDVALRSYKHCCVSAYGGTQIKDLISKPSKNCILIDTREPSELKETGRIPTALNIPIVSQPDSFFISEEEFEDRFGFERPQKDKEVVFYCKAGVRSRAAAQLAHQAGWEKTSEYPGSWLDWAAKEGIVEW